nr:immunoglobulin light chain junction region [Macaca mulatta]MOX42330.1 immunoglobulin light chain junction region [Macaca mulatta]MOX42549.1 immunoglobulin light chain junction region [Macaca mulatta]MOX43228.1 immunoglobulin light chain junction region [Macaca mulatta]MOX43931.1 immunoglobulin light chain junction region [Macaca mulatta]
DYYCYSTDISGHHGFF